MNKFTFLLCVCFGLFIFGSCSNQSKKAEQKKTILSENGMIGFSINYGEVRETRRVDGIVWQEGMTVLDVLDFAQNEVPDFTFRTKQFEGMGSFVFSIDSLEGNNKKYWLFCINGRPSEKGIGSKMVEEGDEIVWYFTKEMNPCKK